MRASIGSVSLRPPAREELDAVVFVRVVAGGDHRRRGAALAGEVRDAGSGEHAGEDHVGAFGADSRDQRRLEHRAGTARVAADDERLPGAEHARPRRGRAR